MSTDLTRPADLAPTPQEAALLAAQQATEASGELLRYLREGEYSARGPFGEEVVGKLAEALNLALEIEAASEAAGASFLDEEEAALTANLKAAIVSFLEGWVG